MVEIEHGNGLVTRYAHAKSINVAVGDIVRKGQTIAVMEILDVQPGHMCIMRC